MGKETIYATATASGGRLRVPVGEIDVEDGTVFNTTQRAGLPMVNVSPRKVRTAPQRVKPKKEHRLKRKKERQNRKAGRK